MPPEHQADADVAFDDNAVIIADSDADVGGDGDDASGSDNAIGGDHVAAHKESAAEIDVPPDPVAVAPGLSVENRQSAFALLEQIGAYYRVVEPSSPIPFITDRARGFAGRDFVTLLNDLLPAPLFE